MTPGQFQPQMNRLIETYGKIHYGTERGALIWQTVKDMNGDWFQGIVSGFIGEMRTAPLLNEFRAAVSHEREKRWNAEKVQGGKEAKEFFQNTMFDDESRKSMMATIIDRLQGRVSDQIWNEFVHGISKLTNGSRG